MALTLFVATCRSDSAGPCVGTLVFTAQPSSLTAGIPFTVTVQVQNSSGSVQSCFSDNVQLSIGSGPAGGTIQGTTTVAAVSGVATFSSLTITKSGPYTLAASATGLTAGTSSGFTTVAATATALSVTTQPTSTTAGGTMAAIVVTVLDQFANTAGFTGNVIVAITPGTGAAGATLSGTTSVSGASGVASFSTLSINKAGTAYTLTATATGLAQAATSQFNINPGASTKLVFLVQPSNGSAGSPLAAVQVQAQDAQSNPTPNFVSPVTIAIGTNAGGGTLTGGGPVTAVAGVATFSGISINKPGTGYTLTATSGALTLATSATFNVAIGPLAQLVFTQQPTNATAGAAIAPAVVVTALDAGGNTVTGFTGNVDMSIGTNPASGTLSGLLTAQASAGVATFSNLSIDKASPGYTLTATAGAVNQTSASFSIIAGSATQLVFTMQPGNTLAGASVTPAVIVTAQDVFNNSASSFANAVTVAITGGTGDVGAALSGTLTKPAVAGVVSFNDLSIDSVGTGYTLSATASGLVGAFASASFNITPNAATQLVFTTPPSNRTAGVAIAPAVVVTARDFKGNTATGFTGSVSVAIGNNAGPGGVLSGNAPVNATVGVATFSNLSINKSGIGYTLTASSTGLTGATSAAFNIIAGAATKLAFTVPPVNTAAAPAAITPAVQVSARDNLDNTDLTFTGNVTVAIGNNAGPGGILSGTLTATVANGRLVSGVATFNDLTIDKVGTGYTLTAGATGLLGATSTGFNIFANTATHLVFFAQPTNEVAGVAIAPAVVVHALDASNNVATGFTGGISVAITPLAGDPAAVLSGLTTVPNATAGVATFSNLSINKTADGYALNATAGGLGVVTSAGFDITPAAATHLVFSGEPSDEIAGAAIAPTVEVSALDAFDNVDTSYTTNIAVAIGTNPPPGTGILSGTTSVPATNGVAVFSTLSINRSAVG
ncbi:MAG: beta strand repeat-containing protein, partial [Gemmatimonadales bacterium]